MSRRAGLCVAALVLTVAACGQGASPTADTRTTQAPMVLTESPAAIARLVAVRAHLPLTPVAIGFDALEAGHFRARIPSSARSGVAKAATVTLPSAARGAVSIEDETSKLRASFALRGASDAPASVAGGFIVYEKAYGAADVVHRVHAEGTEDYVYFGSRPATEEVVYDVDVTQAAGLRLVANTLELLDPGGSPRLRVSPPYVVDGRGQRLEASLSVEGCAYDASPSPPWERAVTAPGAASCAVHIAWHVDSYPALVDPQWAATGSMATARSDYTATLLATGRVLVVGGYDGDEVSSAELYDPVAGTFAATGSLTTARQSHTATLLATNKVLVAGGRGSSGLLSSAQVYDPGAGTFSATGAMTTARDGCSATLLSTGKVLVAGAMNFNVPLASAELYDPAAGTFSATGGLGTVRGDHTATLLTTGKVLIAGGQGTGPFPLSTAQLYDPAAATFSVTGAMGSGHRFHTATRLVTGMVLVAGGGALNASAELYDPASGKFTGTGALGIARSSHTATLMPTGRVLFTGGNNGAGTAFQETAELYDPTGGKFRPTTAMAVMRYDHTATLLPNGKVLVAGGAIGTANTPGSSAELLTAVSDAKPCTSNAECETGFCVDGVCCDAACSGQCQACDVLGKAGKCTSTVGAPHGPRPACTGAAPCGAACDGVHADECTFPNDQTSCGSACTPNKQTNSKCSGTGVCIVADTATCNNLICADANKCKTTCATGADCLAGATCNKGACVTGIVCVDDHTSQAPGGPPEDCGAYKCQAGCKLACASVNDCVAPNICGEGARCVMPSSGDSGGCSTTPPGPTSHFAAVGVALALLYSGMKRRRNK